MHRVVIKNMGFSNKLEFAYEFSSSYIKRSSLALQVRQRLVWIKNVFRVKHFFDLVHEVNH